MSNVQLNPAPIQTQSTLNPMVQAKHAEKPQTNTSTEPALIQDNALIGTQKSKHSDHPVQLHSLEYGKKGAIGGAIAGGVALPVVAYLIANYTPANLAFTAGFALQTLAVGAAGGAAIGGVGGLTVGGIQDGIQSLLKK